MKKDIRIDIATIVYYDGVEGYTTHRALYVDYTNQIKLTAKSKKALKKDFDCAGCEILKVDLNGRQFSDVLDFATNFDKSSAYHFDDSFDEVQYVKDKFIEYFN